MFFLTSCGNKKGFQFTGKENDAEAFEKCLALSKRKKFEQAVECLEIFKSRYPNSTYALDAELKIADSYYNNKEWLLAAESYQLFAKLHPSNEKLDYAYYRAGMSYLKLLPKSVDRDMSYLKMAQDSFTQVYRFYPDSPYAKMASAKKDEVLAKAAKKNMYVANFYFKYGEYRAAASRYINVLKDYSGLGYDELALYRLALSYHRLGLEEKAQAAAELMQEKFPNSKKTKSIVRKILGG